jgi:hypothetical protein
MNQMKKRSLLVLLLFAGANAFAADDGKCQTLRSEILAYLSEHEGLVDSIGGTELHSNELDSFSRTVGKYYQRTVDCVRYYVPNNPKENAKRTYAVVAGGLGRLQVMSATVVENPAVRDNAVAVRWIKREYLTLVQTLKEQR